MYSAANKQISGKVLIVRSRAVSSGQGVINLQGQEVAYHLHRVRRRKRLTVLVDAKCEIQVRVPWRVTLTQVEQFVHDNASWVLKRLQHVQKVLAEKPTLQEGCLLPFLDDSLQLCYGTTQIRSVFRDGDCLWVLATDRSPQALANLLEPWYRQQAQQYLSTSLQTWSGKLGLPFKRLTIRDQKSRWGSCSAQKTISLNWRLMFLPTNLIDYVLVHELCHLRHMNHSAEFWAMVAGFIPEYAVYRRRLRFFPSPW